MNDRHMPTLSQRFLSLIRKYLLGVIILALALAFEAGRYSVYYAHPELSRAEQAQAILSKVGQLIQLPRGETPTMAAISDAAAVKKDQPFLSNAENGDVLIVYQNAQEALLYRPSTGKLIAVGPVNNPPAAASVPAPITAQTIQNATSTKPKK